MRTLRVAALSLLVLALVAGSAVAKSAKPISAPAGLKAFVLRANEKTTHEFPRTPAFSWAPARGATKYEFQVAKSPAFTDSSILFSSQVRTPAVSLPVALPWMTGNPYAAYARVRAITTSGLSGWSTPFGFNIRWASVPTKLPDIPGLSRWTPVEGATSYHVWFTDIGKVVGTRTNAVDQREFYTFHQSPLFSGTVHFRVRAVRSIYGSLPSGLPRVTYGPWSPLYTSVNPAMSGGTLNPVEAVSESTVSTASKPEVHQLTPAFSFTGTSSSAGTPYELYRVYVFSDRDCVNVIYRGAVTGAPAYAARTTGPLALPASSDDLTTARSGFLADGSEGKTFMADTAKVQTTESDAAPPVTPAKSSGKSAPAAPVTSPDTSLPSLPLSTGAPVDLWESGWPNGRFYWTVVPVQIVLPPSKQATQLTSAAAQGATAVNLLKADAVSQGNILSIGSGPTAELVAVAAVTNNQATLASPLQFAHGAGEKVVPGTELEYHDVELPQDTCATGREIAFGKESSPVVAGTTTAYASGLSPKGRLVAAVGHVPSFFGSPLVAWQPVLGADTYQVQWSKKDYPWKASGTVTTQATGALLPLKAGAWFYRVRAINNLLPGTAKAMSWSKPQQLRIAAPKFSVVGHSK